MGVSGLGGVHGHAAVPDIRSVQDGAGRAVRGRVQRALALAVGRLHRVDHHRLLHGTWRLGTSSAVCASIVPVLARDVLRVLGAPCSAALRRHASHTPDTYGRTLRVHPVPGSDSDIVCAGVRDICGLRGAHGHHAEDRLSTKEAAQSMNPPPL